MNNTAIKLFISLAVSTVFSLASISSHKETFFPFKFFVWSYNRQVALPIFLLSLKMLFPFCWENLSWIFQASPLLNSRQRLIKFQCKFLWVKENRQDLSISVWFVQCFCVVAHCFSS